MRFLRQAGSLVFVLGLFVTVFAGVPWHVITSDDPVIPLWLRGAIFCLLGGILVVLVCLAVEQRNVAGAVERADGDECGAEVLLNNSSEMGGAVVKEVLGVVQGHTVYAIWLGKDLSAIVRLILGGELTEYTDMMGKARTTATARMKAEAAALGADAIINVRYMTTSVVGSAAELLAYGTAVKLGE